jgi:LacI family transcriptional regulator
MAQGSPSSVTLQDVAARTNVSAMTVSRVINQPARVAPATRERVEQAIRELGFVPNALARGLLRGRNLTIAVLFSDIGNPFFTQIVHGAEDVAQRNGYSLILANSDESPDKERQYIHTLLSRQIDGLLVASASNASRPLLELLSRHKKPFVLIDRVVDGVPADVVVSDNIGGARTLTEHLIGLGHHRIGLINGLPWVSTARERRYGYMEALRIHGIEARPELIVEGNFKREGGARAARQLLALPPDQRPTAIFADTIFHAVGAIECLRSACLSIPQDIALVCFDDIELVSAIQPFLTTVSQPAHTFGTIGMQILLERLDGGETQPPRKIVLPLELTVRISCGARA